MCSDTLTFFNNISFPKTSHVSVPKHSLQTLGVKHRTSDSLVHSQMWLYQLELQARQTFLQHFGWENLQVIYGDMIWYVNIVYVYTIVSRLSLVLYTRIDMYDFDSWGIKRTSTGLPCYWLYSGLKSRSSCHTDQVVLTQVTSNWSTAIAGEFPRGSQEHEQRWNSAGSLFLFLPHMFSKHLKYQRSQRFSCALVHRKANNLRLLGLILREAQEVFQIRCPHTQFHSTTLQQLQFVPIYQAQRSPKWILAMADSSCLALWRLGKTFSGSNSVWVIVKNPPFQLRSENQARVLVIQSEETLSVPQIEMYSELCIATVLGLKTSGALSQGTREECLLDGKKVISHPLY